MGDRDAVLRQFMDITALNEQTCREILEQHGWSLERAVPASLGMPAAPAAVASTREPPAGLRQRHSRDAQAPVPTVASGAAVAAAQPQTWMAYVGAWTSWALYPVRLSLGVAAHVASFSLNFVGSLVPRSYALPSSTGHLRETLSAELGIDGLPRMLSCTAKEAFDQARRELKFLVIYLHSPSHENSSAFCRHTLTSPELASFLNDRVLFWGESVSTKEGHEVASALRAVSYPFLAVALHMDNRTRAVDTLEAAELPAQDIVTWLTTVMDQYEPQLVAAQADRAARSVDRTLREEQDRAYEESLRADREKAERRRREEEEKLRLEQEAEQARLAAEQALVDRTERRKRLREAIPPPPPADCASARLRFQLPDGAKLEYTFAATEKVQTVYDFIEAQDAVGDEFSLFSGFPKKKLADRDAALEDAGLAPKAMVYVQDETD